MSNLCRPFVAMSLCLVVACGGPPRATPEVPAAAAPPVTLSQAPRLPVSLNDVMVALVNEAADPLWVAAWKQPETDRDWRELERRAYQLELAGSLIAYPGTGALDVKWAAKPEWRSWSNQLRDVGAKAVAATQARDILAISRVGDSIVAVCEGCHATFKPDFPTQGKFGELSPTSADIDD